MSVVYERDDDGLHCVLNGTTRCSGGPCTISYCEDGEAEQHAEAAATYLAHLHETPDHMVGSD